MPRRFLLDRVLTSRLLLDGVLAGEFFPRRLLTCRLQSGCLLPGRFLLDGFLARAFLRQCVLSRRFHARCLFALGFLAGGFLLRLLHLFLPCSFLARRFRACCFYARGLGPRLLPLRQLLPRLVVLLCLLFQLGLLALGRFALRCILAGRLLALRVQARGLERLGFGGLLGAGGVLAQLCLAGGFLLCLLLLARRFALRRLERFGLVLFLALALGGGLVALELGFLERAFAGGLLGFLLLGLLLLGVDRSVGRRAVGIL